MGVTLNLITWISIFGYIGFSAAGYDISQAVSLNSYDLSVFSSEIVLSWRIESSGVGGNIRILIGNSFAL